MSGTKYEGSKLQKVVEYLKEHPDATQAEIKKSLKLKDLSSSAVSNARKRLGINGRIRKGGPPKRVASVSHIADDDNTQRAVADSQLLVQLCKLIESTSQDRVERALKALSHLDL